MLLSLLKDTIIEVYFKSSVDVNNTGLYRWMKIETIFPVSGKIKPDELDSNLVLPKLMTTKSKFIKYLGKYHMFHHMCLLGHVVEHSKRKDFQFYEYNCAMPS